MWTRGLCGVWRLIRWLHGLVCASASHKFCAPRRFTSNTSHGGGRCTKRSGMGCPACAGRRPRSDRRPFGWSRGCASAAMPSGRAGITGTPSFTSAGTCTKSRGSDRVRDEGVVADFLAGHLPGCRCYRRPVGRREEPARRGLAHLLVMLREEGAFPPVTADEPPYRQLIGGYCRFLCHDRGLAETTVADYRRYVRDFLVSRGAAVSPVELAALGADDLLAFSRQRGAGLGRTAWNHLATALSGFYRWLDMSGHGGAHLAGAVPLRRRYRLADVPCALSWEQVRRLLGAVDLREPNGRRNYAMLLLIASYGLRGCEVRALRLNDIDWAHDEIVIFAPKTGRRRALPLTRPVGEA